MKHHIISLLISLLFHCKNSISVDLSFLHDNETIIILDGNLNHIVESTFARFKHSVQEIYCFNCNITDIDNNAFRGFKSLQKLYLDGNKLTKLDGSVFKDMDSLVELGLSDNNLTSCPNIHSLLALKNLKLILINGNQYLDQSCSDLITSIINLKDVPCTMDKGTYFCKGISSTDIELFPDNIVHFEISNSPLGIISRSVFSRFARTLEFLRCNNCSISYIDYLAFSGFEHLRTLDLANNELDGIHAFYFGNNTNLETLDIRNNAVNDIDGRVFRELPNLKWLHLSNNNLTCLDLEALLPLKEHLKLDILDNPNLTNTCVAEMRRKGFEVDVEMWKSFKSLFY